jgi:hypothetical protein
MIKLSEIEDYLINQSGNFYFVKSIEELGITKSGLYSILKPVINNYFDYLPPVKTFNLDIYSFKYEFEDNPPEWIIDVIPLFYYNNPYEPLNFFWEYRNNVLYVNLPCRADVRAVFDFEVNEIYDKDNKLIDVEINDISSNTEDDFLNYCLGQFMVAIGRSRRAVSLVNNYPVSFDGDSLVQDGKDVINDALSSIKNKAIYYF